MSRKPRGQPDIQPVPKAKLTTVPTARRPPASDAAQSLFPQTAAKKAAGGARGLGRVAHTN